MLCPFKPLHLCPFVAKIELTCPAGYLPILVQLRDLALEKMNIKPRKFTEVHNAMLVDLDGILASRGLDIDQALFGQIIQNLICHIVITVDLVHHGTFRYACLGFQNR